MFPPPRNKVVHYLFGYSCRGFLAECAGDKESLFHSLMDRPGEEGADGERGRGLAAVGERSRASRPGPPCQKSFV